MDIATPILVTGGTGFIGRRMIDQLLKLELAVASFALPGEAVPEHWGDRVSIHRGDITSADNVHRAMQGIKTVIHLAALVSHGAYQKHWDITVEGSRHVFDAALASNSKVVLAASVVVYGDQIQTGVCHDELAHGAYQGAYSRAKMAQEKLALDYQQQGMTLTVIRPANVYGKGSGPWVEGLFNMLADGGLVVVGDGSGNAGLVHVDNLVSGFLLVAGNDKANGRIYTVCDGLDVSWWQYFHDLAAMKGVNELPQVPLDDLINAAKQHEDLDQLIDMDPMVTYPLEYLNLIGYANRFDSSRIRNELGWKPTTTYSEALDEIREGLAD